MHSSAKLKCQKPSSFISQESENMLNGIRLKCYKSEKTTGRAFTGNIGQTINTA